MSRLTSERCIPCEKEVPPLSKEEADRLLGELRKGWQIKDGALYRQFDFYDFKSALAFVNRVGEVAEREWHHPDIEISFNKVKISLITHSIKGLSKNDFILAAHISELGEA